MRTRTVLGAGIAGAALVAAGCGSSSTAPLARHVGAVTIDGKASSA